MTTRCTSAASSALVNVRGRVDAREPADGGRGTSIGTDATTRRNSLELIPGTCQYAVEVEEEREGAPLSEPEPAWAASLRGEMDWSERGSTRASVERSSVVADTECECVSRNDHRIRLKNVGQGETLAEVCSVRKRELMPSTLEEIAGGANLKEGHEISVGEAFEAVRKLGGDRL